MPRFGVFQTFPGVRAGPKWARLPGSATCADAGPWQASQPTSARSGVAALDANPLADRCHARVGSRAHPTTWQAMHSGSAASPVRSRVPWAQPCGVARHGPPIAPWPRVHAAEPTYRGPSSGTDGTAPSNPAARTFAR